MKTLYEALDFKQDTIFVIVKPGFLKHTKDIIKLFEEKGWTLGKIRTKQLLLQEAQRLYEPHKKEDFFKPLCEYMISEPTTAILFVRDEPLKNKFKKVGELKDTIREKYGESEMRNCIHSSDSEERLNIEKRIYF